MSLAGNAAAGTSKPVAKVIELLHTPGCANVDEARSLLRRCLAELRLDVPFQERQGDFASPTILVNGIDVMGRSDIHGAMCRLDLPTRERVVAALTTTIAT